MNSNIDQIKKTYSNTRYAYESKRGIVWYEICRYLTRNFSFPLSNTLELGCGYGDFIGNLISSKKTVIEIDTYYSKFIKAYGNEINILLGDVRKIIPTLPSKEYDSILASNFFEHFTMEEICILLREIHRIISNDGTLIVIQPNYRFCASKYYDDSTHRTVFSHVSFGDLLQVMGFRIEVNMPIFLPFSFKSRFPVTRLLVRLYLLSPFKPMGAQFLIIARKQN